MAVRPIILSQNGLSLSARTSITFTKPSTILPNDVMIIFAMIRSTSVTPTMTGWTQIDRAVNTTASRGHQIVAFARRDDGTGSSWSLTWGGTSLTCSAGWGGYRGCPTTGAFIEVNASTASAGTTTTAPYTAVTTVAYGSLILWMTCSYQSSGFATYQQPQQWWYGPQSTGGNCMSWEYDMRSMNGVTPTPSPRTITSDAWSSITVSLLDGNLTDPAHNIPIGLDGVNSSTNGGWGTPGYLGTKNIGANYVRVDFDTTSYTQSQCDAEFADAAAQGLSVLPIMTNYQQISTMNFTSYCNFVSFFSGRYGPGGTFWSSRGDGFLAPTYIEILNEPWGTWFYGTVEPNQYANLFVQAVTAGRAANSATKYLFAGVDRYYQSGWQDWWTPIFSAQPTIGNYIDGVTAHLYGITPLNLSDWTNYQQWPEVWTILSTLWGQGINVKVWVTEFGFTTTTNTAAPEYGMTQAQQATQITEAMALFHRRWSDYIGGTFLYRYRDGPTDTRENRWGIYNNDNTAKPAVSALQSIIPGYLDQSGPRTYSFNPFEGLTIVESAKVPHTNIRSLTETSTI